MLGSEKKIGIIDADLIRRKRHRFPNLALEKISGFEKGRGNDVELIYDETLLNRESLSQFNDIYVSKVFTDTDFPEELLHLPNVRYGGSGFFWDKSPRLVDEIEHSFPDYHLYDDFIENQKAAGRGKEHEYDKYLTASIGFLTRGCFRHCSFCINKESEKAELHSPVSEFLDEKRRNILLLDDNILSHPEWNRIFDELSDTGKYYSFNQGMDVRLLTERKSRVIFGSRQYTDVTFAFDNVADYELIGEKIRMINHYTNRQCRFYVLCGFDREGRYDEEFWQQDIADAFTRICLLLSEGHVPYIMRHENYNKSPYRGLYVNLARWTNQVQFVKAMSFRQFCKAPCHIGTATEKYLDDFEAATKLIRFNEDVLDFRFVSRT